MPQRLQLVVPWFLIGQPARRRSTAGRAALFAAPVWGIGPGGPETGPSLYRIEATVGPGSGVKILNAPVPLAFRESTRYAEQNLYTRVRELVGDREPRSREFSVQLRAMDNDRAGESLGLPVLLALCGALLEKSLKGGLDRGRSTEPRRIGGATGKCGRHRGSRGREERGYRADPGIGSQAALRAVRRHGNEGQRAVLLGHPGRPVEGAAGVSGVPGVRSKQGRRAAALVAVASCTLSRTPPTLIPAC